MFFDDEEENVNRDLHDAISQKNINKVKDALDRGADVWVKQKGYVTHPELNALNKWAVEAKLNGRVDHDESILRILDELVNEVKANERAEKWEQEAASIFYTLSKEKNVQGFLELHKRLPVPPQDWERVVVAFFNESFNPQFKYHTVTPLSFDVLVHLFESSKEVQSFQEQDASGSMKFIIENVFKKREGSLSIELQQKNLEMQNIFVTMMADILPIPQKYSDLMVQKMLSFPDEFQKNQVWLDFLEKLNPDREIINRIHSCSFLNQENKDDDSKLKQLFESFYEEKIVLNKKIVPALKKGSLTISPIRF